MSHVAKSQAQAGDKKLMVAKTGFVQKVYTGSELHMARGLQHAACHCSIVPAPPLLFGSCLHNGTFNGQGLGAGVSGVAWRQSRFGSGLWSKAVTHRSCHSEAQTLRLPVSIAHAFDSQGKASCARKLSGKNCVHDFQTGSMSLQL